jgi:hypothetical protein
MAEGKLSVTIGTLSFSGEGEQVWVTEQLENFFERLPNLTPERAQQATPPNGKDNSDGQIDAAAAGYRGKLQGTVAALAAKLTASSGADLIMAAAAKLTFVDGQESFSRKTLLEAMRTATNYYKRTYRNNLSGYLKTSCRMVDLPNLPTTRMP